jgi:hypothetical protein
MKNWKHRIRVGKIVKKILKRRKPKFKVWRKTSAPLPVCEITTWDIIEAVDKQLELQRAFPEDTIYITGDYK